METLKKPQNNNKLKISARTWNDKFELPEGSGNNMKKTQNIESHLKISFRENNFIRNIIIIIIITLFQVDGIKIQNVIQVTYARQLLCKIYSAN